MIVTITNLATQQSLDIRRIFAFSAVKRLNDSGMLKISFPDDIVGLDQFEIKKGNLIQAFLMDKDKQVHCVFSWYIEERSITNRTISLVAYDFLGYTKHRMLRSALSFANASVQQVVNTVIQTLNTVRPLPFQLRLNDCKELVTIEFGAYTSLYVILKDLAKKVEGLEFRHVSDAQTRGSLEYLDVSTQTGIIQPGIWADNINVSQRNKNIVSRERRDSFGNYCNYRRDGNGNEQEQDDQTGLLFEKFEQNPEKMPDNLTATDGLPTVVPELTNDEIAQIAVGDRKQIRLIAKLERAKFEYLGIIQETSLSSNTSGGINFAIKIGEKVVKQKNLLDRTLENLSSSVKKSGGTSSSSAPATINTSHLAPKNHKHTWNDIEEKPATFTPSSHTHRRDEITGKPTSFTPATHDHDSKYYQKSEINDKLNQKANDDAVVHRTGDETIAWKKTFADVITMLTKTNAVSDMSLTIGTRHMISEIAHGNGGHITQILRWDCSPEGNKFDGGRWLEFGSHGDPYLSMNTHTTTIGRSAGNNWVLRLRGSQVLVNEYDMLSIFDAWKDYTPERRAGSQLASTITNRYAKYKVIGKTCFVSWEATIKNLSWSIKEVSANLPLPCTIKQGGSGVYHDGLFRTLVAQIEGERMYFFRDGEAIFSPNGLIRYAFTYEIA